MGDATVAVVAGDHGSAVEERYVVAGGRLHQRAPHPDGLAEGLHARAAVVEEAPALAERQGVGAGRR